VARFGAASSAPISRSVTNVTIVRSQAFGRYSQDLLDRRHVVWMKERGVAQQRVDRRQPGVTGRRTVAALDLEVV
jgi:hypothetical protein